MFFATPSGQRLDPFRQSFGPADIEELSGASPRQIREWVRRKIISTSGRPGRGNPHSFTFHNLFEARIAYVFSVVGNIWALEQVIDKVRQPYVDQPESVLELILRDLPEELSQGALAHLAEDIAHLKTLPHVYLVFRLMHTDSPTATRQIEKHACTVEVIPFSRKSTAGILNVVPQCFIKDGEGGIDVNASFNGEQLPMTLTVSATHLFLDLAHRLLQRWE